MDNLDKVITDILADPDMPEHMVTVRDDEQMRALLEKHILPLRLEFEHESRPKLFGLRGCGGNKFIEPDGTRGDLMNSINDQLGDIHEYASETDREIDVGAITIVTERIPSGKISVTVMGDLKKK